MHLLEMLQRFRPSFIKFVKTHHHQYLQGNMVPAYWHWHSQNVAENVHHLTVGSVATQVLPTFLCYWSTKSHISVFCSQYAVIYNYINHIMQSVIFSKWLFVILYCFTFCSFLLWETIMIQMYCCLGNHSPTQGFRGWFESGDKNVSRNICVRALTQLFSFLWDKHVGLHLRGCQFHGVAASLPFHSHVWVMLPLNPHRH